MIVYKTKNLGHACMSWALKKNTDLRICDKSI